MLRLTTSKLPANRLLVARNLTVEGKWKEKERAVEEQYFAKLNKDQAKKFAERLHSKELKELLKILPDNHNLSEQTLHDLMEWKHGKAE